MTRLEALTLGAALLCSVCGAGCGTVMLSTRLTEPARSYERGLGVQVAEVHVSAEVRSFDFSDSSRVLVLLDLTAQQDTQLELKNARLTITGVAGSGDERYPIATGIGQPPARLQDGEFAPRLDLRGGQFVRAWVAFGNFPERANREIPERIALDLPTGHHLLLSRPGQTPIWQGKTQTVSFGYSAWVQMSADESAFNFGLSDNRVVAGPLVIGYRAGFGVRTPHYQDGKTGDNTVCCNWALAADVAWPIDIGPQVRVGPFLGVESAFMTNNPDITRRTWVGPSLGVELSGPLPVPLHGPFPINYERSRLGNVYLRAALVHWFGPDRAPYPSFGMMLSIGTSYGL
ncbi:MAG TPA: hypothetical protein VJV78_25195 [Polyangiales bacterium]|nr:hypothetical protein [Polyangiales bacterium]